MKHRATLVSVAQFAPEVLDLRRSVAKAATIIQQARKAGASIVAFPETWIPVYPFWADMGAFSRWDHPAAKKIYARLHRQSLEVGSDEFRLLASSARKARTWVVIGVNERAGKSLYNSLLFFSDKGEFVGHHRKLVPTHGERLVWGHGDATGLRTYETAFGSLGGLICWEHWIPPARQVLHEMGETIHVAAWPHGKERHQIASRHYAFEGRTFVLAAAQYLRRNMLPKDYELSEEFDAIPEVILDGGSAIIGPDGEYVRAPVFGKEELVTAEIEPDRAIEESLTLDVGGHYSRPDVFRLEVRRVRRSV